MLELRESEWRQRQIDHIERLGPAAEERTSRTARGEKHPVRDFLFEYYSYRPSHLVRWSPGSELLLQKAAPVDISWSEFEEFPGGLYLPASRFPPRRRTFLTWALAYLEGIAQRPPSYGCFGLHEWAMVYRTEEVRHTRTPFRLSSRDVANVVEQADVCCTHFDAYRFFTPEAVPLNRHELTREATERLDQRGCIHVTMDLYRYAYKLSPFIAGELIQDTFALASRARELDMRASPYDLTQFGFEPIRIETRAGKEEYVEQQKILAEAAIPVRDRLIEVYRFILRASSTASAV